MGLVDLPSNSFFLEAAEERFRDGIIITVAPAAHAGQEAILAAKAQPLAAAVLRTLIRMNDHFVRRLSSPYGHQKGIEDNALV